MIYDKAGNEITSAYDALGNALIQAYDIFGNELMSGGGGGGGEDEFIKTTLPYTTTFIITPTWLSNATVQRNAMLEAYQASNDAIPFFIQTDGHGRYSEGNKACHNLAEPVMKYIANIQLGDYASYYNDGANPARHTETSQGIINYLPVMGNHEFLNNNSDDAELADLPTLVTSYVPANAILGGDDGYYKVLDSDHSVKYLVTQTHIPDEANSKGFRWDMSGEQYEWLIDELKANDGYDVVVLQHEPIGTGATAIGTRDILAARGAKTTGSYTDSEGVTHDYDFTGCEQKLLCSLHGHAHAESYITKETFGFPVYVADWFGRKYTCLYGLIDRDNGKLTIWKFDKETVNDPLVLDL